MQIIKDREPDPRRRFPAHRLVEEVVRCFRLAFSDRVAVTRLGGTGDGVWRFESRIDSGEKLVLPLSEVVAMVADRDSNCDELRCIRGDVVFGVFDASYMFVQGSDKEAERCVADRFADVEEYPDRSFEE